MIVMLTVKRTLRCLSPDLRNEVLVTFATRIFNSQYKRGRHGFFDDCKGDSVVSRRKRSILNTCEAGEQAGIKKYPGTSLSKTRRSGNGNQKILGVTQCLLQSQKPETETRSHEISSSEFYSTQSLNLLASHSWICQWLIGWVQNLKQFPILHVLLNNDRGSSLEDQGWWLEMLCNSIAMYKNPFCGWGSPLFSKLKQDKLSYQYWQYLS